MDKFQPAAMPSTKQQIFDYIRSNVNVTKQEILINLNFSLPTINAYIKELLAEELIIPDGEVKYTGGRNAVSYALNKERAYAIGIDITRYHITTVLVDLSGEIIDMNRIRCPFSKSEAYLISITDAVNTIVRDNNIHDSKILGVGIGVPALTNYSNDVIVYGEILGNTGMVASDLQQYLNYNVLLFNDALAAGFAETWSININETSFYLMLSNNVGGSVFVDGDVYYGNTLKSGEIGHIRLHPKGKRCYCGQEGCSDSYLSATALIENTEYTLDEFFHDHQGMLKYPEKWNNYLDDLALAINTIRMVFDSDVIIGGYVGAYFDEFIPELQERVNAINTFGDRTPFVKACKFKTESIATGSALKFVDNFLKNV